MTRLLEMRGVSFSYGGIHVLWDIDLNVEKGEIVALLGPNGAGKSTTLKLIHGMIRPLSGEVKLNGERIDNLPTHKIVERGVTLVLEGRRLFRQMSVLENLELGALTKRSKAEKKENLQRCFQLFPILKERQNQLVGTLSGGEMQMLAIARALMASPELLLLDEPSLGLAPKIVYQIFQTLKEINQSGITILLVEQNVMQALKICNRGYVLETGRIVLEGDGKTLVNHERVKKAYIGI